MLGFLDKAELKGREEGKREGLLEGRLEGKAEGFLRILVKRGLSITPAFRSLVESCTDAAQLDEWFDRALTAASIDEVFAEKTH